MVGTIAGEIFTAMNPGTGLPLGERWTEPDLVVEFILHVTAFWFIAVRPCRTRRWLFAFFRRSGFLGIGRTKLIDVFGFQRGFFIFYRFDLALKNCNARRDYSG